MGKVNSVLASPNFDMVRWNFHDSKDMIAKWERIESDEDEWKVEGGIRSGGRKLSRRMSELLGNFEYSEGGGGVTKLDDDVANCSEGGGATFSNLTIKIKTHKFGPAAIIYNSTPNMPGKIKNVSKNVSGSELVIVSNCESDERDWLSIRSTTANERPASAQKRKLELRESEKQRVVKKKCTWD